MSFRTRAIGSVVLAIAATATTAFGATASASTADESATSSWHRYHQQDSTVPAGDGCSFKVAVKVMYDREYYRILTRWDNGRPRLELWRGPLILRFTNTSSHKAVVRNVSGVAYELLNRDKSFHAIKIISGHFSATLAPGSDPGQGIYYVGGHGARLIVRDDGTEALDFGRHGHAENLCDPLGT